MSTLLHVCTTGAGDIEVVSLSIISVIARNRRFICRFVPNLSGGPDL
ncbi:hypothetical protein [Pseudomonas sp. FP1740]|nr:hypothetical protein [Pseudomonas sp. FP1740]WLG42351.1 hypothetical protein PSH69_15645 [Pseudomonas sp. FP1740]